MMSKGSKEMRDRGPRMPSSRQRRLVVVALRVSAKEQTSSLPVPAFSMVVQFCGLVDRKEEDWMSERKSYVWMLNLTYHDIDVGRFAI